MSLNCPLTAISIGRMFKTGAALRSWGARERAAPPAWVLWEYVDSGRRRALVRVETRGGLVVRQLHWHDELLRGARVLELPLRFHQKQDQPHDA